MARVPSPVTVTDELLVAILGELRALRAAVEDGAGAQTAVAQQIGHVADAITAPTPPTARTRTRTRSGGDRP